MKKITPTLFSKTGLAILGALIMTFSGCVKQEASKVETSEKAVVENAADPEFAKAQKLIEEMKDSPVGYSRLTTLYIKKARETGDFGLNTKAEDAVDNALKIKADDPTARKLKASLQLTFHRFDKALELGKQLEKDFPNDAFVLGVLTDANVELGNYETAFEYGQKMIDTKPNTASYARAAHLRSLDGEHDGSIELYKQAARTADPSDKESQSWCLVQLGDELWKYGKYPEAEKVYDEALTNFPNYYLALAGKGKVRAAQGDFENAVKILNESLNRIPNVENAILLGDIYTKQGNAEQAKQQYELVQVIEQKIGVNNDQKRLAMLWADQNIKLDEALEIATREHQQRKDIFTADTLAWILYKKGNFAEAKKASDEAMRLKANDARILYHAGMIEKELGNKAEAKKLLKKAIETNPKFDLLQTEIAQKTLAELK